MIAIASAVPRERAAFYALCESNGWAAHACDSLKSLVRLIHHAPLRVILVRQYLQDGYSDDVFAELTKANLLPETKVIVLVGAGTPSSTDVRQISLGADCVQRDPIRTDILQAYIIKYLRASASNLRAVKRTAGTLSFSGATLNVSDRTLQYHGNTIRLTPRELALAEWLVHSRGEVVTYETLYREVLGRRFNGDTSNMRVLLRTLSLSSKSIGIALRHWVEVIPKTGYRYNITTGGPASSAPEGVAFA